MLEFRNRAVFLSEAIDEGNISKEGTMGLYCDLWEGMFKSIKDKNIDHGEESSNTFLQAMQDIRGFLNV